MFFGVFQMSMIWVISGAGRSVGKTTVAMRLCEILPHSIYAKCGHGGIKPEKDGNFFNNIEELKSFIESASHSHEHIIIESNALAKSGNNDITIFIDGIEGKTNFRKDAKQLRASANINISRDGNLRDWKKVISEKIGSKHICDQICNMLLEQKLFLFNPKPVARSKVWFESSGVHIFGSGLASLLENVNRSGTLQEAAKASNMSYRYAWSLINAAERHFGKVLINRHAGGRFGGGSTLSPDGLRMLDVFRKLNEEVAAFTDEKFAELYTG
jgi:molybdate transport system regulatory protein